MRLLTDGRLLLIALVGRSHRACVGDPILTIPCNRSDHLFTLADNPGHHRRRFCTLTGDTHTSPLRPRARGHIQCETEDLINTPSSQIRGGGAAARNPVARVDFIVKAPRQSCLGRVCCAPQNLIQGRPGRQPERPPEYVEGGVCPVRRHRPRKEKVTFRWETFLLRTYGRRPLAYRARAAP